MLLAICLENYNKFKNLARAESIANKELLYHPIFLENSDHDSN